MNCPESELIMQLAWRDCLLWSVTSKDPDFLAIFRTENGLPPSPRTPLDAMIDDATGVMDGVGEKYIEWFNKNVWGDSAVLPPSDEEVPFA